MPFGTLTPDATVSYRFSGLLKAGYVGSDSQTFSFDLTRFGTSDRITKTEEEADAAVLALFEFFNNSDLTEWFQVTRSSGNQTSEAA